MDYVQQSHRERYDAALSRMQSNENPFGASPKVLEVLSQDIKDIHLYPERHGDNLKEALAAYYRVRTDEIALGNGSSDLIEVLIKLVCDTNSSDEILTFAPSFPLYGMIANLIGVRHRKIFSGASMQFDVHELVAKANKHTKICFIANPNNPTGTYLDAQDILYVINNLPDHILLVLDEAYYEYVEADDYPQTISMRHLRKNIAILRTFSKAYGLAGMRVGYLITNPELATDVQSAILPFRLNALGQRAALEALKDDQHLNHTITTTRHERDYLRQQLKRMGLHTYDSETNFVLLDAGYQTLPLYYELQNRDIQVRLVPDLPAIRITVHQMETNIEFLQALKQALKQISLGSFAQNEWTNKILRIAHQIETNKFEEAKAGIEDILAANGANGTTQERTAYTFANALAKRMDMESARENLYSQAQMLAAFQTLLHETPFIKYGHITAANAIAHAAQGQEIVHVVDFGIGQGTQWLSLIPKLAENDIHILRITGIDLPQENDPDPVKRIAAPLRQLADEYGIGFEYRHITEDFAHLNIRMIKNLPGEFLALNAAFALHHLDEQGKNQILMQMGELHPDLMCLVEPDTEHDQLPFMPRVREAMAHYGTVFDALGTLLADKPNERAIIEQSFFGKEIEDVMGADDELRFERHQRHHYWVWRMGQHGCVPNIIRPILDDVYEDLGEIHEWVGLQTDDNSLRLYWKDMPLVSTTIWQCE